MEASIDYKLILSCKIELSEKSVELPLEDSSHSATSNIKLEAAIDDDILPKSPSQHADAGSVKLEMEIGDEQLPTPHSRCTSIHGNDGVDIKSENPSQPVSLSHHSDCSDTSDNSIKAEISSRPSEHSIPCQELVYIDRDDQRCKMDCDVSIPPSGSGSPIMAAAATVETGQDNNFEYCQTLLEKGVHEDILPGYTKTCGNNRGRHNNRTIIIISTLHRHREAHSSERSHECPTCGKTFSRNNNLKNHIRVHTGEKLYECSTCGNTFYTNGQLKRHMRIHTGQKPFECPTCGKTFFTNAQVKKHIRIHTGEKPFECPTCGKTFSRNNDLKRHIRVHTGEKPYECSTCGKTFSGNGQLKKHIRIHTDEKPFECSTCGKTFSENGHLKRHIRIHNRRKDI